MARTKNSSKCDRPKHKARVTKASFVAKNQIKMTGRTFNRGEKVEYSELTHRVTSGAYKGSQGKLLRKESEGNVTFLLLRNARGNTMKEANEIVLAENDLEEVDRADMLSLVGVDGQEEEDRSLLAYEKKTWKCPKCNAINTNEGSWCNNVLEGGKVCSGTKKSEVNNLGWGDCFKNDVEKWSCGECTLRNDMSADECIACGVKKESPTAELSTIDEESNNDDDKIVSLSAEVKRYSISGKGKRLRRN